MYALCMELSLVHGKCPNIGLDEWSCSVVFLQGRRVGGKYSLHSGSCSVHKSGPRELSSPDKGSIAGYCEQQWLIEW
jgi:hypothetical protein